MIKYTIDFTSNMHVELIFIYSNSFIEDKEVSLLCNHEYIDHPYIQGIQVSQLLVPLMYAKQNKLTLSHSNNNSFRIGIQTTNFCRNCFQVTTSLKFILK